MTSKGHAPLLHECFTIRTVSFSFQPGIKGQETRVGRRVSAFLCMNGRTSEWSSWFGDWLGVVHVTSSGVFALGCGVILLFWLGTCTHGGDLHIYPYLQLMMIYTAFWPHKRIHRSAQVPRNNVIQADGKVEAQQRCVLAAHGVGYASTYISRYLETLVGRVTCMSHGHYQTGKSRPGTLFLHHWGRRGYLHH